MAEKRKISVRKVLQLVTTIIVSIGCFIAMLSAASIEDSKTIARVAIHIQNDKKYHFIEQKQIMDLAINNRNIDTAHTPLSKLDIHGMEKVIMADPWVAHAQVYIDNERVLHMYVTQRIPVARVFQQNGTSYYLDSTLSIMPLSKNNIYYTTVVTNVPELKNDSIGWATKKQIVSLVKTIQADSFWNAQISQVAVDSGATFELIPVLGDHKILFGNALMMREKFDNLFAFYKNVLNRIGWDKYEVLDLRFKGQVVASPSLPYVGPIDKAIDKMNWINSIVETEARNDAKDSFKVMETKANAPEKKHEKSPAAKEKGAIAVKQLHAKPLQKVSEKTTRKKETDKKDKKKDEAPKHKKEDRPNKGKVIEKKKEKDTKEKNNKEKGNSKQDNKEKHTDKADNAKKTGPKYLYPEKKIIKQF